MEEDDPQQIEEGLKEQSSKQEELLIEAKGFIDYYKKEIGESLKSGTNVVVIDFMQLSEFSNNLADEVLANPEEALRLIELAIEESGRGANIRVRLKDMSESQDVKIRNIRSKHLNELLVIEGIIRQASDVRPQVVNAKFECPSCGTIISVLQIEKKFREPSRCSCGRRGGFKLISKEMVDTQRLIIEEAPDMLTGGEQPKRINVFVKEDLVEPKMEEKTTPGARVKVIGILKEVPVPLSTGGLSTRFELAIEANNLIPLEETFEELDVSDEDEKQILELSQDPQVFEKLAESIAPSVWGYKEIKESMVLQLFGGVQKQRTDGQKTRGDMHILLIGDPGVAKSVMLLFMANISPKGRYVVGKSASLDYNELLLIKEKNKQKFVRIGEFVDKFYKTNKTGFQTINKEIQVLSMNNATLKLEWKPIKALFRHKCYEDLIKFNLETGREITVTRDHSIFCIDDLEIKTKPSQELKIGDYVVIPKKITSKQYSLDEEIAKFLGYFIAEGHLYNLKGSYKIEFTLHKNEKDIMEDLNNISKKYFKKQISIKPHGENGVRVTIYGKQPYLKMCSWLGSIKHKKALEKGIPEIILNSNLKARTAFIKAYIKGDAGVTKSKRLMSDLHYLFLQDEIISSSLKKEINRICEIKGRKIHCKGQRYDLLSPKINKKFQNLRTNFPLDCLSPELKLFFKRKIKQDYNRINFDRIDNKMLLKRILRIYKENEVSGKKLKKLFGENSLEYFSDHKNLFKKIKKGRETHISLTEKGLNVCKDLKKLNKLLNSDIAFVKIKSIENTTTNNEFVYDVSVPENENFIAGFGGIVCHNSGAGLTASVVRDEYLKGWSLEAGALVLSNKGLVSIDELEKMDPTERSAMHEAMEQQTVTISKANIQASLKAQTSILAAANPKFGRFDPTQGIPQQIDLPPTLINRFDIIFALRDLPNKANDEKVATHILTEHQKSAKEMLIDKNLFRKYVAYAKQRFKPQLTNQAVAKIKEFYVNLRNKPMKDRNEMRSIPISARQLGSLIRMAEASAKLRLNEKVEAKDAELAIRLIKYYLEHTGYDEETGQIDIDKISGKLRSSQRNKIFQVRDVIFELRKELGEQIPIEEIEKKLEGEMNSGQIDDALDKLAKEGTIFRPRRGFVQKV